MININFFSHDFRSRIKKLPYKMNSTRNCLIDFNNPFSFTPEELQLHGIFQFFLCLICMLVYLIVLFSLMTEKSFRDLSAYKIIFHLGLMDLGVLFFNYFVNALMMLFNSYFNYTFSKVSILKMIFLTFRKIFLEMLKKSFLKY